MPNHSRQCQATAFFFLGLALLLFAARPGAWAADRQFLRQHVPPAAARLTPTGVVAGARRMPLAIALPPHDPEGLARLLRELYDPASPNFHQFLSPAQFAERFGAREADYAAAAAFAEAHGLTVTDRHANRLILSVEGDVDHIQQAFHVKLRTYRHPSEAREFYAPDVEPSLDLTVPVSHIAGLNDFGLPRPLLHAEPAGQALAAMPSAGSGPGGAYGGNDFRNAYVPGTTLTGAGQNVGLLQFDGYFTSDIVAYRTKFNLPSIKLVNVSVNGGVRTPGVNNAEVCLDIQMVNAMAPGLSAIYVYEAPNTASSFLSLLSRMANDNLCKQLSCSWAASATGANPAAEVIFQQMAAQGQSFFNASGDSDAYTDAIPFPCDSPNVTSVGGTTLNTNADGSYNSESAWNWNTGTGSSGGVSTYYAIPGYQQGVSMTASNGSTTMRNIPDVALTADNVYVTYNRGGSGSFGGTSCAAPLWAAYTALLNQYTAANAGTPVGFLNPSIYAAAASFNDVATGNNFRAGSGSSYAAVAGYDLCTGWGTPRPATFNPLLGGHVPPSLLTYSINPVTYSRGVGAAPNLPSSQGGLVATYTVSPALPAGLTLNAVTGAISGIASVAAPAAIYTIKAGNVSGSTTTVVTLGVNDFPPPAVSTSSLLEGPSSGRDSVLLSIPATAGSWSAASSVPWLQVSTAGMGSATIAFSFDANPGGTRTGTLTVAGFIVTVTQAGANYAPVNTPLPLVSSGLAQPTGIAVDGAGHLYIADSGNNAIKQWSPATGSLSTLYSGAYVNGVALDLDGNVCFTDATNAAVRKWIAATGSTTTLVSQGLSTPSGLGVDGQGNVYFADSANNRLQEFSLLPGTPTVTALVSSGLNTPVAVAVDLLGDAYFSDSGHQALKLCAPGGAAASTLNAVGPVISYAMAIDGSGNVYFGDNTSGAIQKYGPPGGGVSTLVSGGHYAPAGLAVDAAGNVFFTDGLTSAILELPRAFIDPTPKSEPQAGGPDSLATVVPATLPLTGPLAPSSDQSWLTIGPISGGVITFTCAPNAGYTTRVAYLTLLGQKIPVTQAPTPHYALSIPSFFDGPSPGSETVALIANGPWSAASDAAWLHLDPASLSGSGNATLAFTLDPNTGAARTGTITVAGQTLTISQATVNTSAITTPAVLVSQGLSSPQGLAVDSLGNLIIADAGNHAIKTWTAATGALDTVVSAGLSYPKSVALDGSGNIYIGDTNAQTIKLWSVTGQTLTTLASTGPGQPSSIAVDAGGNVYSADYNSTYLLEYLAASQTLVTLLRTGLIHPAGLALDAHGNLFISDAGGNALGVHYPGSNYVSTLAISGLINPGATAVDSLGDVFVTSSAPGSVVKWSAATRSASTAIASGLSAPSGLAVDAQGNIFVSDSNTIKWLPRAFLDFTPRFEPVQAGTDSLAVTLPPSGSPIAAPPPSSDQGWLTVGALVDGQVNFAFTANLAPAERVGHLTVLGQQITVTQAPKPLFTLGTATLVKGPQAGVETILLKTLPAAQPWAAAANAPWLHVDPNSASGAGNSTLLLSYDENPGDPRTGTITIGDQILTVIQAGANYVSTFGLSTPLLSPLLSGTPGLATDKAGNVYVIGDPKGPAAIVQYAPATGMLTQVVAGGTNYYQPTSVAVDSAGNIYFSNPFGYSIWKWNAATKTVSTIYSAPFLYPRALTVDAVGNLYFAGDSSVSVYNATTGRVSLLIPDGLSSPYGLAADLLGNLYIADTNHNAIQKWTASTHTLSTLASTGTSHPLGIGVDGSGNVYFTDDSFAVKVLNAATQSVTTLLSSSHWRPYGVALDATGDLYVGDFYQHRVSAFPQAWVDASARAEPAQAGTDQLPMVVPATQSLLGAFAPASDQPWLTIDSVSGGVVHFSFTSNTGFAARTAHIALLGQQIAVTQALTPYYALGTSAVVDGPADSGGQVKLTANAPWTAAANDSWIHLAPDSLAGQGSVTLRYVLDPNNGTTRSGTITVAGQTLSITQAGTSLTAAGTPASLISSGLLSPAGLAVDGAGHLFIADTGDQSIKTWSPADGSLTTLISTGLSAPTGVAVDAAGTVYIADAGDQTVKRWTAVAPAVSALAASGPISPAGLAVDGFGGVYCADRDSATIQLFSPATQTLSPLVTQGLSQPSGIAADAAGDLFIADPGQSTLLEYDAGAGTVIPLANLAFDSPQAVALDGRGDVYLADASRGTVEKWSAATQSVSTLVSAGLSAPAGVAVDGFGNVYIADTGNGAIKVLPRFYIESARRLEPVAAASDVLAIAQPAGGDLLATHPPASDQAWLTITSVDRGAVTFAFTTNETPFPRTARLTVLGETVTVTQAAPAPASLHYAVAPVIGTKGVPLAGDQPTTAGGAADSWSASPALPAGLSLDPTTGVLTGTPTVIAPAASYVVTAANGTGSTTAFLVITINDAAPTLVTYPGAVASYTKGVAIAENLPGNAGGAAISWSIQPALPPGLQLDPASGTVRGTPMALSPAASYTVTATNSGGSTTASLVITVHDVPPSALTYPTNPAVFTVGAAAASIRPRSAGGPVLSYGILPALPAGLRFDPATGALGGTPTVVAAASTYTVTATNSGGSADTALQLTVLDTPPVAAAQFLQANTQRPLAITLQASETIPEPTVFTILQPPRHGSLSGSGANLTYTSAAGFAGVDSFTCQAADAGGQSSATVTIAVSPVLSEKGTFVGLIEGPDAARSGTITVASSGTGTFTAALRYGGVTYPVKGIFDASGHYPIHIARRGLAPLTGQISFEVPERSGRVVGSLGGSDLIAGKVIYGAGSPAPQAGRYSVKIPPDPTQTDGARAPQGYGVGTLAVTFTGTMTFTGTLADGTKFSQGTSLTQNGVWYLFLPLYATTGPLAGMLEGAIQFQKTQAGDLDGAVAWIRPGLTRLPYPKTAEYPAGFDLATHVYGATYSSMSNLVLSAENTFQAQGRSLAGGSLSLRAIAGRRAALIPVTGLSRLTLSANPVTGLISGSFKKTATSPAAPVFAVIYQGATPEIVGGFLDRPEAGAVSLTSP